MKFGRKISNDLYNEWRPYYIDYTLLKRELKSRTTSHNWDNGDEEAFTGFLNRELDKVYGFQTKKTAELATRIKNAEKAVKRLVAEEYIPSQSQLSLRHPSQRPTDAEAQEHDHELTQDAGSDDDDDDDEGDDPGAISDDDLSLDREDQFRDLEEEVADLVADVHDLALFSKLNITGFMKILKKHDKQTGFTLKQSFVKEYLDRRPFYKYNWDALIIKLSRSYDLVRTRGHPVQGDSAAGGSQSAFVRQTTKYWVHPDNLVQLKLAVLRHLPVLVFNSEKEFEDKDAAITSIYFDNEDLELYLGRLEKTEGAQAIRLRWYGDVNNRQIFVERKTHREDWTGEKSVKARFPIKEDKVNAYLRGEYTMDEEFQALVAKGKKSQQEVDGMIQLANEVQYAVLTRQLSPVMRTFYNRTAFQLPGDARVRISLDTELTMVREDNWDGRERAGDNWRRTDIDINWPFDQLPAEDKELFKYGVLEVKLQTQYGQEPPQWVTELVDSHLVEAVPKFSKFIHGCATLMPHRVDLVPFWLPQMDVDILKPDTGLMSIARPQHSHGASSKSSRQGSSGIPTPDGDGDGDKQAYVEPVSEGEEDEVMDLALARDEGKRTGLGDTEAASAIAYREKHAKEREESPNSSGSRRLKQKIKVTDYAEENGHDLAEEDEQTPFLRRPSSPPTATNGNGNGHALSIDPLAPSSAFDETFRSRVKRHLGRGDEDGEEDGEERMASIDEGVEVRPGDDRVLERNWRAPAGKRIAVPVRVEPKVYFATERTFLKWLHFSVYIGTIATALLNFIPPDDTRGLVSAALFTFTALLAIVYSAGVFVYRAMRLRKRRAEGMYYDRYGPTVLCAVLLGALVTNLVLRLTEVAEE